MSRTNPLFFLMMFFLEANSLSSYSQAIGDFGSAGGGGNWGASTTWKLWNGAAFVTPTGSVPNTADNAWITAGSPVVVETSPKLCNNLTIQTGALLWTNNAAAGNLFIEVHGNILCDGQIGNGATYDQISFDIAGANVTISGTGKFDAGRIWKNTSTNATSNLIINRNVILHSANTQIYNNLGVASYFNVTVGVADSLILVGGSAAIDGLTGTGLANQAGTFTIDGYMDVQGILYLRTTNTGVGYDCKWIVNGELRANEISAGASSGPSTKDSLIVKNGGLLKITGTPAFSTLSTSFNTYNFLDGSTVEYAAIGTQTVRNSTNFGGGLLNQYYNLIISGSGTKTLVGTAAVRNNLTISDTSGSPVFSVATFNITVGGNWTNYNQGGFTEGVAAQSVTFNGGSGTLAPNTQTIDCPGGEFFNNISLNKGGLANSWFLKMNNDVTVAKVLSFSGSDRAALDLNGHTLYLTQAGTASLAGSFDASNSRYIVSETAFGTSAYAINPSIIKWTSAAAAANYTFPFGVNGSYLPL